MAWQQLVENGGFPPNLQEVGAAVYNDLIHLLVDDQPVNGREMWTSPDGIEWTQASADGPWTRRERYGLVVFDGVLLLMGGHYIKAEDPQGRRVYLDDIWAWDGTSWSQWGTLPSKRSAFTPFVFDNKLWVIGGREDDGSTWWGRALGDIRYTTDGVTWTTVFDGTENSIAPFGKRRGYGVVVTGTRIVLIGGERENANGSTTLMADSWTSLDGSTWVGHTIPKMLGRRDFGCDIISPGGADQIWIYGGKTQKGRTNDVWVSVDNGDSFQFREVAQWSARYEFAHCAKDDKLFVIGFKNDEVWSTARWVNESGITGYENPFCGKYLLESCIHTSKTGQKYLYLLGGDGSNNTARNVSTNHGPGTNQKNKALLRSLDGKTWEEYANLADYPTGSGPFARYPRFLPGVVGFDASQGFGFVSFRPPTVNYNRLYVIGGIPGQGKEMWVSDDDGYEWSQITYNNYTDALLAAMQDTVPYDTYPDNAGSRSFFKVIAHVPNQQDKKEYLYMFGGYTPNATINGSNHRRWNDVWRTQDPELGWELIRLEADWGVRHSYAVCSFCERIWLSGGEDENGDPIADMWSSKDGITWTQHATPPWDARERHLMVASAGRIYVYGGSSSAPYQAANNLNDVWSTSDGETWVQEPDAEWGPRSGATAQFFKNKLWHIGGQHYEDIYASSVITNFVLDGAITAGATSLLYKDADSVIMNGDYWIYSGTFYHITSITPDFPGANAGTFTFSPALVDNIANLAELQTVVREPAQNIPCDDDRDIYDSPVGGGLIWSLFTEDEPGEECRKKYSVEVLGSQDIEIDSIQIRTSSTNELVTRLIAYFRENYFKADPKKVVFTKNTRKFGIREKEYDFFIYNDADTVKRVLQFWGNRKSEYWKEFIIRCFLAGVPMELYDVVAFELESNPKIFGPQALGIIKEINYSPKDYSTEIIAQSAIKSGTSYNAREYWSNH